MTKYVALLLTFTNVILAYSAEIQEKDGLLVLNDNNFQDVLDKTPYLFVTFYSNHGWLSPKFLLELPKVVRAWKTKTPQVSFGKIFSGDNQKLVDLYSIQGYPTLILFINGEPNIYNGLRYEDNITAWINRKLTGLVQNLLSVKEIQEFNSSRLATVIYFGTDKDEINLFTKIAEQVEDNLYAVVSNEECMDSFSVKPGTLVVFRNIDDDRHNLSISGLDEAGIKKFININSVSPFMYFNEETTRAVFFKEIPSVILFRKSDTYDTYDLDDIMKEVAQEVKGKYLAISADIVNQLEYELADYLGVWDESLPTVKLYDPKNDKFYNLEGEITKKKILQLIDDWENGKLKYSLKSEEIPKQQGKLYKVVSKSFEDVVINLDKNVLVLFWYPFTNELEELIQIGTKLSENLKNVNLLVTEFDSSKNVIEIFTIKANIQVVLWCAKDKKNPITYDGELKYDKVMKFVVNEIHKRQSNKNDL